MKEETKKSRPKKATTTAKKTVTKKTTVSKPKKEITKKSEPNLNETVNLNKAPKQEVVINNDNYIECPYCHKTYEKGYTICPNCHKRQGNSIGLTFFIVFAVVFLFGILVFHFADKYIFHKSVDADYKESCILVDYENLVRHPKDYKNKDVKVIGEVLYVDGFDSGYSNDMTITINANLFENGAEQLITVRFSDKSYDQGFIAGDTITIYGKYTSINGNVPAIEAKYIIFGNK